MANMDDTNLDQLVLQTLNLLEWRLKRLEFVLNGNSNTTATATSSTTPTPTTTTTDESTPVTIRLQKLEQALQRLASKSDIVSDLIKLHSRSPDLFLVDGKGERGGGGAGLDTSVTNANADADADSDADADAHLDQAQKLSIVLADAPAYQEVASQLRSLNDMTLPPAESFASWAKLNPRIERAEHEQYRQAMDMSELRKQSAAVVLGWHELFVLAQGRCWVEWESRLRQAERHIRRAELHRERDLGED